MQAPTLCLKGPLVHSPNIVYLIQNGELVDDVMIVDKERLFLENIGAVHQLSKMSGDLGDRIDDLEKANESVAVSLCLNWNINISARYIPDV